MTERTTVVQTSDGANVCWCETYKPNWLASMFPYHLRLIVLRTDNISAITVPEKYVKILHGRVHEYILITCGIHTYMQKFRVWLHTSTESAA